MKYAFIVLIAIYLVTYGCSPDKSEEPQSSHEPTATLENPPQGEMAAAPADKHEPVAVQQEPAPPTAEQYETAAAATAPEDQAAESEQVLMPCGRTMAKADVSANAPCLEMQKQVAPEARAGDSEQVVMPCGRTMAKADVPENAPCPGMQSPEMLPAPDNGQDLPPAMQRMVETTNGMIVAARQLVAATYEMLNAGKGVAEEIVEPGKEIHQDQRAEHAAGHEGEAGPEEEVIATMQQFISAAREVIDATNRAVYSVVEEKKQQ